MSRRNVRTSSYRGPVVTTNKNAEMPASMRGVQTSKHQRGAISTTFTERTLGASTRQGWRLACTPAERKVHGSKVTRNTAEFVASGNRPPMYVVQPGKNGRRTPSTVAAQ